MPQIDKVLVFDIWGDYAHFRKIETTTSPLTYSIPTGTVLTGIISGIVGYNRDSYYDLFSPENLQIAIRVLNPIKKIRININLIKTDECFYLWDARKNAESRSPTPFEFVKEPNYRIYIWLKDKDLQKKSKNLILNHQSFYTPYLGISELIANFKFVNEFDVAINYSRNEEDVHTVVRGDRSKLIVEEGKRYIKERIPIFMDSERVVQEYADVFFEANAKSVRVRDAVFYKVGEDNVVFL